MGGIYRVNPAPTLFVWSAVFPPNPIGSLTDLSYDLHLNFLDNETNNSQ